MPKPPGEINFQDSNIKLSVVILNYNTRELLEQCLASLPDRPDYEIIVVDNASTDDSVKMVGSLFPRVKIVRSKLNCGFTRGNNLARNFSRGEYVLFLNSDTKVFPKTLPCMVAFMDDDTAIGISTCRVDLADGRFYYASHRGFPSPWNSLCYFSGLSRLFPRSKLFSGYTATYLPLNTVHEIDACSGTFLLIRRRILNLIGWFDEDYYSYGEDIEMCYRVKQLGYKVMFNPEVRIVHYWGASSGLKKVSREVSKASREVKKLWHNARYEAMGIFYRKHYQDKYPGFISRLVFGGIALEKYFSSFGL